MSSSHSKASRYLPGDLVGVLLPLPLAGPYDYRTPEGLTVHDGDFVLVPFGRREIAAVVWGEGTGGLAPGKVRDLIARFDAPPLPAAMRRFIDWVSAYTVHPPGAVLKMVLSVPKALEPAKSVNAYTVNEAPPDLRMTPARARVFQVLENSPPLVSADLAREAAVGPGVVRDLIKAGALKTVTLAEPAPPEPDWRLEGPGLSPDQGRAAKHLQAKVGEGGFAVSVLDGVPGSGKTEVYFQAVAETLKRGRQVLVLLPEIALGAQWLARFVERFGAEPASWHSDLSPARRRKTWRAVAVGRARVVVGARSALFLPFDDLGLIVVDEEHDGAFKQEEGVIYHARDMAVVRARLGDFPVVLVSATPSLETVANVAAGKYQGLLLPDRHAGAVLPDIEIVDMRAEPPPRGQWLSPKLREAVEKSLAGGEQAMLFLNRRGFAPLTLCRTCGHRLACPRCTAWLVEHRARGRLHCHHCGYNLRRPERCPECEGENTLVACGPGVERLAEEAAALFPQARLAIAASDTLPSPAAAKDLVRRIENHQVDLLVGTQIVAKGYHFPMLTLVGVVDADLGLTGGDLRAAERTYQLLYQVAGRAGRAERPGRVVLQTYLPEHPVMAALVSGDRERFLKAESQAREDTGMPPFGRLAALIVSGRDDRAVREAAGNLARTAPRGEGVTVLGPAPAPLAMLRGRHRHRLLLKARKGVNVQGLLRAWLKRADVAHKIRVQVDVDPISFH